MPKAVGILLVEARTEDGGGWGAWGEFATYDNAPNRLESELHAHLDIGAEVVGGGVYDGEARFTIHTPLACTIVYRIDSLDGDADPPADWVEGTESTTVVLPNSPATIAAGAPGGLDSTRVILVGIIWHPWT